MGNSGSVMEKVYIYLPVIMFHSRMDYADPSTLRTMRMSYFIEQALVFVFTTYFIATIKQRKDEKRILVPDVASSQVLMNTMPNPEELKYKATTYFKHEMTQAFQQLQQAFVAFMLTIVAHFIVGIRPILLLQIFSTPYNFIENRLFRKYVLGLKPRYRVWGERFDGEVQPEQISEDAEGEGQETGGSAEVVGTPVEAVDGSVPVVTATVVPGDSGEGETVAQADAELPMPKKLEDALIDAWDTADRADWSAVSDHLGPLSVNTQTPKGRWTPLMVACGLPKLPKEEVKTLVSDLDARVDLRDEDGWTCAHWAAQQGNAQALQAVFEGIQELASGPEAAAAAAAELVSVRDNEGKTPAEIADAADHDFVTLKIFMGVLKGLRGDYAQYKSFTALD